MSELRYAATRFCSLWRSRGAVGLCRFFLTRLIRTQSDLVFERILSSDLAIEPPGPGRTFLVVDRGNLDEPAMADIVAQLLRLEASVYRFGLERADMAFVVIDRRRRVLHHSFVQFETRYKRLLGETVAVPLLTHCHTEPEARGERLYPRTLRYAACCLAKRGFEHAVITCDAQNEASIRGILRAGFRQKRAIRSLVILARLVIQRIRAGEATSWRFARI